VIAPAVLISTHDCSDIMRCQKANQHETWRSYRRRGDANLTQVKTLTFLRAAWNESISRRVFGKRVERAMKKIAALLAK
jgi:hypothetical protein